MYFSDLPWPLSTKLNHLCRNPAPVPGTQDGINFPCLQQLEPCGGTDHCSYCNVTVSGWYAQRVNAGPGVRSHLSPNVGSSKTLNCLWQTKSNLFWDDSDKKKYKKSRTDSHALFRVCWWWENHAAWPFPWGKPWWGNNMIHEKCRNMLSRKLSDFVMRLSQMIRLRHQCWKVTKYKYFYCT